MLSVIKFISLATKLYYKCGLFNYDKWWKIEMDAWIGSTWFAGREYIVAPLLIRPRRVRAKNREYVQHIVYVPRLIARTLYDRAEKEIDEELPVITMIAPATWFHVLNWKKEPIHAFNQLPLDIRLELEALGLAPTQEYKPLTVLATSQEIEELGIDHNKPVTLEELKRKILEKAMKSAAMKLFHTRYTKH